MARVLIVYNPTAGPRRRHRLDEVRAALAALGVVAEVAATAGPGDATRLARAAAARGVTTVVAAGGDGTIAEVAAGLVGGGARLGVVPLGTANVLARERALPFAPAAVAQALVAGRTEALWPGYAEIGGCRRLFVQMCGIGFDAAVVSAIGPACKRRLGRGAYVVQSLRSLGRYDFPRLRLAIDGVVHDAASAVIGKGRFYAGPYLLLPRARPDEPGFQVALFAHGGPAAVLGYGALLPLGLLPRAPGVRVIGASRIELLSSSIPVQADGDAVGETPVVVTDASSPIPLIVRKSLFASFSSEKEVLAS